MFQDFRRGRSSHRLEISSVSKFSKNTVDRFFAQARIRVHNLCDAHSGGQRFENQGDGDGGSAHSRTTSKMLLVSDNPGFHTTKLTPRPFTSSRSTSLSGIPRTSGPSLSSSGNRDREQFCFAKLLSVSDFPDFRNHGRSEWSRKNFTIRSDVPGGYS